MSEDKIRFTVWFLIVIIAVYLALSAANTALSESDEYFVICKPGTSVNARISPNKRAEIVGWFDCGDKLLTDGKTRNGFVHIIDCSLEVSEAWIHAGYLVEDEPVILNMTTVVVSYGRVACRKCIGGKRTRWAKPGTEVTIYARSDEWCVTNKGFVMTKYLGVN